MFLLAQAEEFDPAFQILNRSADLAQETFESWNRVWIEAVSADSDLWSSLVRIGLILAVFSILYLALTEMQESVIKQDWQKLASSFISPILIVILLSNNGYLLAEGILAFRTIGLSTVQQVTEFQLADLTYAEALRQIRLGTAATEQVRQLYSECMDLTGERLEECVTGKELQTEALVNQVEAELDASADTSLKRTLLDYFSAVVTGPYEFLTDFGGALVNPFIEAIKIILYALQWAFVNTVELSLLLTALFLPISVGLNLITYQGRLVIANVVGLISLYGIQLGYNIIVGLVAIVLVETTGPITAELSFAFFLSLFAPLLAVVIPTGGGIAMFNAIKRGVDQTVDFATDLVKFGVGAIK